MQQYTPEWFYHSFAKFAEPVAAKYNIPILAILAQAALESGWGKHAPGNMFFGVKATGWSGQKQLIWTTEWDGRQYVKIQDWFRAYETPQGSFEDYAKIVTMPRYTSQHNFTADSKAFVTGVHKGGYATDPDYSRKLHAIIDLLIPYKKKAEEVAEGDKAGR